MNRDIGFWVCGACVIVDMFAAIAFPDFAEAFAWTAGCASVGAMAFLLASKE